MPKVKRRGRPKKIVKEGGLLSVDQNDVEQGATGGDQSQSDSLQIVAGIVEDLIRGLPLKTDQNVDAEVDADNVVELSSTLPVTDVNGKNGVDDDDDDATDYSGERNYG